MMTRESLKLQKRIIEKTPFFYGWVMVFMAALTMFFTGPGQTYSFSIFINHFIADFGWSRAQVNNYYAVATLVSGSTMFLVGKLVDRHGARKVTIITSILLTGSMFFLSFLTGNIIMLLIGFFLGRFSGQGVLALASGVITPHWFVKKRGLAIMLAGLGGSIGSAFFPKLNLFLINAYGWRHAFQILGLGVLFICLPLCIIFIVNRPEDVGRYPDDTKESEDDANDLAAILDDEKTSLNQREALRTGAFWIFFFAGAQLAMIGTGIWLNMLSIFSISGLSDNFATTIMTSSSLIGLAASLIVGLFLDKIKKPHFLLAVMCFMQAASYIALGQLQAKAEAIIYVVLYGSSMAVFMLVHKLVLPMFFGRRYLGGVSGGMTIAWVGGAALGPIIFGNAYEIFNGYNEILLALAAVPMITGISLFFAKIPHKRRGI